MNTRKFSGDMADQVDQDRDQLIEMREVMAWASENVVTCHGPAKFREEWFVWSGRGKPCVGYKAPTLYEALHTAWEKRNEL